MKKTTKTILFCMICFILTFSIVLQTRVIKNSGVTSLSSYKSDDLIDEFFKWKDKYEDANKKIQEQKETLKVYEEDNGNLDEALKKEINDVNNLLGKKKVKGQGVVITVDDSKIQTNELDELMLENLNLQLSDLIVHDTVLLAIVNEVYIRRS